MEWHKGGSFIINRLTLILGDILLEEERRKWIGTEGAHEPASGSSLAIIE